MHVCKIYTHTVLPNNPREVINNINLTYFLSHSKMTCS